MHRLEMRVAILLVTIFAHQSAMAQPQPDSAAEDLRSVLSADEWQQIDASASRALEWLASKQQRDGSFPTLPHGQPGVTSLCVLAFMAHGHAPGEGPYADLLNRSLQYIVAQQKPSGLVATVAGREATIRRNVNTDVGNVVAYNHAISALVLSEAYGMQKGVDNDLLAKAIERGLSASLTMQSWPKTPDDQGGWRYVYRHPEHDSDLSLTGWELMFLRSAKNGGFTVPQAPIDEAVAYIRRCFNPDYGVFEYETSGGDNRSRGMAGAGVLALAHAGFHNSKEARASGEWILRHGFSDYNQIVRFSPGDNRKDRYHYAVFHCCQAMYQLGGHYWEQFFPEAARALLKHQQTDGSWPADSHRIDGRFGSAYTTALAVLSLGAPNQLLPIFQR